MEFQLLPILTFLSLALVASHAALSPEDYWKSVLPNSPMPQAVKDSLQNVFVSKGQGKPVHVGVTRNNPTKIFIWDQTHDNPTKSYIWDETNDNPNAAATFFLEKDLKEGTNMNLQFTKTTNAVATFLPRADAEKIPFSSEKIPEILEHFSVSPDTKVAEVMKETIKECEKPGIKGEEKYCATSLESMVDFCTSKLGKNVHGISTEVEKENQVPQSYRVVASTKTGGEETVVCHKQSYVYAVFYCHKTSTTKAYLVSMEGADGTKVNAVAVCHTDTSAWNPKHLAFQVLKVKPGTVPVCHFLPDDHVVWVQN